MNRTAYLFVIGFFFTVVGKDLFSDGMFMDGTIYAAVANNMALGLGSFWQPHLTQTLYPVFYEHPPLAMGLQSIGFRIFGDGIYVERFYSLFTYLLTGGLIVLIWKEITGTVKQGWIPLFLWLTVGEVIWAASNNMLENTMGVFTTAAVWFYFLKRRKNQSTWLIISGFSLALALLTKGPFCLYIWSVPFFHWLFLRKQSSGRMIAETAILILSTAAPIALLYLFSDGAQANMEGYFAKQVVGSIESVQTVDYRFKIVVNFLKGILPQLLLGAILLWVAKRRSLSFEPVRRNAPVFWFFAAVALSGVLPIMISMKQRAFYILTVYPLFAVGFGYLIKPLVETLISKIKTDSRGYQIFQGLAAILVLSGISISVAQVGEVGRNKAAVRDSKAVIKETGRGEVIGACPQLRTDWGLQAYFARYGQVSLDTDAEASHAYYLGLEDCPPQAENYKKLSLDTDKYLLYRKE